MGRPELPVDKAVEEEKAQREETERQKRAARAEFEGRKFGLNDGRDWGNETFADWHGKLTEVQKNALWNYKSIEGYGPINDSLRSGEPLSPEIQHKVDLIDKAIAGGTLPEDVLAYRGFHAPELAANLENLVGTEFTDKAFISTALDERTAFGFPWADTKRGTQNVDEYFVAEIRLPKGTRGAWMENVLELPPDVAPKTETEFLLPRDTKFRIVSVETRPPELLFPRDKFKYLVLEPVQ